MNNKLVKTQTQDGLILHGYYSPTSSRKICILHIHGMEGNFYGNNFIHSMLDKYEVNDIGFLTVNTRGAGKVTDFETIDGKYRQIGSMYELLEEAHLDITAWIEFLKSQNYKIIILQGHSAGTVKIVRYLFEGEFRDEVNGLILLAPIDPKSYREFKGRNNLDKYIAKAQNKIKIGKGSELITCDYDHDLISFQTFVSWYKQDDLGRMFDFGTSNYNFPILRQISIPTQIIVGSKDEYFSPNNPNHPENTMKILTDNIKKSKGIIISNATHSFQGYEDVMIDQIINSGILTMDNYY